MKSTYALKTQYSIARHLQIIMLFVKTDFILRYENSALGFAWVFLKPFLIFSVLLLVFGAFGSNIEHFSSYLLLGVILFQFFSEGTNFGMNSVLSKEEVILKLPFPKSGVVLAAVINAFIHLSFAMVIFFIFIFFQGIVPSLGNFFLFLFLLFCEFLIILGISSLLSLWILSLRDLAPMWEVFLVALYFCVPIFYPVSILPEKILPFYWLNPLTQIIHWSRELLLYDRSVPISALLTIFIGGAVFCVLAVSYFIRKVPAVAQRF